jgi:hypothetical protein
MRADWPLEDAAWGYCVPQGGHLSGRSGRMYTQTHVGVYRSRDAGATWTEVTDGCPRTSAFPP